MLMASGQGNNVCLTWECLVVIHRISIRIIKFLNNIAVFDSNVLGLKSYQNFINALALQCDLSFRNIAQAHLQIRDVTISDIHK